MTRQAEQYEAAAQLWGQWLDEGRMTALEAWERMQGLRMLGGSTAALACILHETVQQWHDAYAQRMRGPQA